MASVSMAMQVPTATQKKVQTPPSSDAFLNPLPVRPSVSLATLNSRSSSMAKFQVQASLKEKAISGLTAAALTASMVIPDVAEAADSGISPSLKNFLLSIVAGAVVLAALAGAVVGVSNFDPVKRS